MSVNPENEFEETNALLNLSGLTRILLKHLLKLSDCLLFELRYFKDCPPHEIRKIEKIKKGISESVQELFDTCASLNLHVRKGTFHGNEKWSEIESLREQTNLLVDSVKRNWECFGRNGGDSGCLVSTSTLVLLKRHLEGPLNVRP